MLQGQHTLQGAVQNWMKITWNKSGNSFKGFTAAVEKTTALFWVSATCRGQMSRRIAECCISIFMDASHKEEHFYTDYVE
jgi:hypothetical protein